MERKTIGGFIAALRKANGMTQAALAEKLGVSDKTVSRWERDDGFPDLAAVPVLAEIFGVTCDELLRGQRFSPEERAAPAAVSPVRAEKQRQHLLAAGLFRCRTQTLIAATVSVCGLIAALIANLGFLRGYIGFFAASAFFLVSAVCQLIFLNRAFLSVADDGDDPAAACAFRRKAVQLTELSLSLTSVLLGFCLPLLLLPGDTYRGVTGKAWLQQGGLCAGIALVLAALLCRLLNNALAKRPQFALPEREAAAYAHNHRLSRVLSLCFAAILTVTVLAHLSLTALWGPFSVMDGQVFTDYDSFIAYMGERKPPVSGALDIPVPTEPIGAPTYYNEHGAIISEREWRKRTLEDANGEVVCTYYAYNEEVCSVRTRPGDGTALPITVSTTYDRMAAEQKIALRHVLFGAGYVLEALVFGGLYLKKRAK